jgi:hypothetical protein
MDEEYYEGEEEEKVVLTRALCKAREAFEGYIGEESDYDGAFFRLSMRVDILDTSFEEVLETIEWEDKR